MKCPTGLLQLPQMMMENVEASRLMLQTTQMRHSLRIHPRGNNKRLHCGNSGHRSVYAALKLLWPCTLGSK